jgi:hypothetical protein
LFLSSLQVAARSEALAAKAVIAAGENARGIRMAAITSAHPSLALEENTDCDWSTFYEEWEECIDCMLWLTCLCIFTKWFQSLPACIKDHICHTKPPTARKASGTLIIDAQESADVIAVKCFFCSTGLALFGVAQCDEDVYCRRRYTEEIPDLEDEAQEMHRYGNEGRTWNDLIVLLVQAKGPELSRMVDTARTMIKNNPPLVNAATFNGNHTILAAAIHQDKPEFAQMLLECGANPNILDTNGWAAMHHVAFQGCGTPADAEIFLSAKDANKGSIAWIDLVSRNTPDLTAMTTTCGSTPLDLSKQRHILLINLLAGYEELVKLDRLMKQDDASILAMNRGNVDRAEVAVAREKLIVDRFQHEERLTKHLHPAPHVEPGSVIHLPPSIFCWPLPSLTSVNARVGMITCAALA